MVAVNYAPTLAASPGPSPEALALQQEYAKHLLAGNDQPIHSWSQGLAGIVDALVGGTMARKAGEKQAAGEASAADQFAGLLMSPAGGGMVPGATPQAPASPSPEPEGDIMGLSALPVGADGGAAPVASPPAATGAPLVSQEQIAALLRNPFATPAQKAMALELWKAQHPAPVVEKPTDDMREYNLARQQGYAGSFRDYMIEQKKAGATTIPIDQRAEGAEAAERGRAVVGHFKTLAEDLPAADQLANGVSQLESLLQGVDTGSEAALRAWIADNTGVALGDNVDKLQSITALTDYMAPRMRVPGSGASSDRDVALFKSSLPSLIRQPGGNQIIIDTLRSMANHRLAVAQISEDYLTGQIESKDALAKMRDLPDPMADFKKAAPTAPETLPPVPAADTPPPAGINPDEWNVMTPDERALFAAPVQGSVVPSAPPVQVAPPVPASVMFNPDSRPVYNGAPVIDLSPAPPRKYPPIPGPTGDPFLDSPMRARRG